MDRTLLLNATYEPLQIVSWQRAVRMLFQEKVEVVENYQRDIRSVTVCFPAPAVVRLRHFVKVKQHHRRAKFSRSNLFARDKHSCQYCGQQLPVSELTYDHVLPVSKGGQTDWTNVVTACGVCNRSKGNRTPEEAGLILLKKPSAPVGFPARVRLSVSRMKAPDSWKSYIFWE